MANNSVFEGTISGFDRLELLRSAFESGDIECHITQMPEGWRWGYAAWYAMVGKVYNNTADWLGLPLVKVSDWIEASKREDQARKAAAARLAR